MREHDDVERAIVLQLLRGDHAPRCTRAELMSALRHLPALEVSKGIVRLDAHGVVERLGVDLWASRATRRLDELALIAI